MRNNFFSHMTTKKMTYRRHISLLTWTVILVRANQSVHSSRISDCAIQDGVPLMMQKCSFYCINNCFCLFCYCPTFVMVTVYFGRCTCCAWMIWFTASEGKLRLMSGSFESLGRVEYFHAGSWTTVHRMNDTAAVVLCRSLGLPQ